MRFKPKGNFVKNEAPFKGSQPKGDASGKPKEHASIVTKWGITPKIVPSSKRGREVLR